MLVNLCYSVIQTDVNTENILLNEQKSIYNLHTITNDSMEIIAILTSFLSPFLPHLLKLGKPVAEEAGKKLGSKLGEGSWEKSKQLWQKLRPKVEEKASAKEAVIDIASDPKDEDYQAALRVQLKKILASDEALMDALKSILEENTPDGKPGLQIVQKVTGDRNQVIGQVTGGQVFGNVQSNVTTNE